MQDPSFRVNQIAANSPFPPRNIQPAYCCAILLDGQGQLVLEMRPDNDTDAPNQLTCFGGGREAHEHPLACLQRELLEELGFAIGEVRHVLTLHTPNGPAWFYEVRGPEQGTVIAREAGHDARWIARAELFGEPLANWHRTALEGWSNGKTEAWVGLTDRH